MHCCCLYICTWRTCMYPLTLNAHVEWTLNLITKCVFYQRKKRFDCNVRLDKKSENSRLLLIWGLFLLIIKHLESTTNTDEEQFVDHAFNQPLGIWHFSNVIDTSNTFCEAKPKNSNTFPCCDSKIWKQIDSNESICYMFSY